MIYITLVARIHILTGLRRRIYERWKWFWTSCFLLVNFRTNNLTQIQIALFNERLLITYSVFVCYYHIYIYIYIWIEDKKNSTVIFCIKKVKKWRHEEKHQSLKFVFLLHVTGNTNPSGAETELILDNIINIIAADALPPDWFTTQLESAPRSTKHTGHSFRAPIQYKYVILPV